MVKRKQRNSKPYPNASLGHSGRDRMATSQSPGIPPLYALDSTTRATTPYFTPSVFSPTADVDTSLLQGIHSPENTLNQMIGAVLGMTPGSNYSACPEPTTLDPVSFSISGFDETDLQVGNVGVRNLQPGLFTVNTSLSQPNLEPQSPTKWPSVASPRKSSMKDKDVTRVVLKGSNGEKMSLLARFRAGQAESRLNKSWLDRQRKSLKLAPAPPRKGMAGYYVITVIGGEKFDGPIRERFNIQVAELDDSEVHIDMGYKMASKLDQAQRRQKMSSRVNTPVAQDPSWTHVIDVPACVPDRFENSLDNPIMPGQVFPSADTALGNLTNLAGHTPGPVFTPMRSPNLGLDDGLQGATFTQLPDTYVDGSALQPNFFSSGFLNQF